MTKSQLLATALLALVTSSSPAAAAQGASTAAQQSVSPFVGQWEGEAATDRWPLFLLLQVEPAAAGLSGRLLVLGQEAKLDSIQVNGDAVTATVGTGPKALTLSGRVEGDAFVGRLRQAPADFPFRLRRIQTYPKPANRIEAWQQDLDTLATRFIDVDRSFSPAERAMFLETVAAIRTDLPQLNDAQITTRIAAAVALADNAHTRLYLLRNRQELRRLPVRLWWFKDGLFVVRATGEHKQLLGCRVDDINGWDSRQARDLVAPLFAGTPSWKDYKSVYSLTSPETLHGVGITPTLDNVEFGLSGCAAAGRRRLAPLPLVKSREAVEAWWDLSPRFRAPGEGWSQVLDPLASRLPLYLRSSDNYRFEHLPDTGILYFQYNRSGQAAGEKIAAFGERLLAELDKRKPKVFVLDLRFNTGGNLSLAADLMEKLVKRTEGIPRFVITGRATFSAGMSAAAPWRIPGVIFVGEPVGDVLEFWSEGGNIVLPNSGYDAHFANGFHSYSLAPCPKATPCHDASVDSFDPHVPATASFADYRAGRDPAMEAILARIPPKR